MATTAGIAAMTAQGDAAALLAQPAGQVELSVDAVTLAVRQGKTVVAVGGNVLECLPDKQCIVTPEHRIQRTFSQVIRIAVECCRTACSVVV